MRQMHRLRTATIATVMLAVPQAAHAQEGRPADEVHSVIEGTWELVEWHVGEQILRPPEMEGRWMVHDGLVMAIRHRNGPDDFESTAGYGEYRWGPTTWTYGYERSEDLHGPVPGDVDLRVSGSSPIRMRNLPDPARRRHAHPRRRDAALGVRHPEPHVPAEARHRRDDPKIPQGAMTRRSRDATRPAASGPGPAATPGAPGRSSPPG